MRLDVFLKISRLIVRRSLAQEFCDGGYVSVNGVAAKSSKEIKVNDEIEIRRHNRVTRALVLLIPDKKQMSKSSSDSLYRIVADYATPEENLLA